MLWQEMFALCRGLEIAREKDILNIMIHMDSKVGVDIVLGKSKCPWRVIAIKRRIKDLSAEFSNFRIQHIWRKVNQPADFLAKWDSGNDEIILSSSYFPAQLQEAIISYVIQCTYNRL